MFNLFVCLLVYRNYGFKIIDYTHRYTFKKKAFIDN